MVMASSDHFTSIRFSNIVLKNTVQNGKLRISNEFTRIYGGGFPNPVFLKPPDGTEWEVHWLKHDDEIWFQKGWKEFARYYSLDRGYVLMFTYEGTSNLEIIIVDKSGLEIDYAAYGPHDNVDVDSVGMLDEIPPQQKARPKPPLSSLQTRKRMRLEESFNLQNLNLHYHSQGSETPGTQFHHPTIANVTSNSKELKEDLGASTFTDDCIRKVEPSTANTTMEALKRASTFRSENPFCIIVMHASYVSQSFSLHMPTQFTDKYLQGKHGAVQLQVMDGRTWSAMYSAQKIHGGWKKFAVDNNLKAGDVCVFELMLGSDLCFKVLIFRIAGDASCSLWQAYGSKEEKMKPERVKELSRQKDDNFNEKWGRGISTSNERLNFEVLRHAETQSSPKNTALGKAIETQMVCTDVKATERTSSFNRPETSRAPEEAKRFSSENPFFTVNIRPCHLVNTSPSVPRDFLGRYYKNKNDKVLIQYGKRTWMVKLLYNPDSTLGKFSAGWSLFARENELQVGDACVFELIKAEDFVLGVHIFRCQR